MQIGSHYRNCWYVWLFESSVPINLVVLDIHIKLKNGNLVMFVEAHGFQLCCVTMQEPCSCVNFSLPCILMYIPLCRDALIGIIRNGGLSSLYAGWIAVLCRNIPHSMIKVSSCFRHSNSMHVLIEVELYTRRFSVTKIRGGHIDHAPPLTLKIFISKYACRSLL